MRRTQNTGNTGHAAAGFFKLRTSQDSVFQDQEFFPKSDKKSSKKNSPAPYRLVPLPPTKVGAKCLTTVVLDNLDRVLRHWGDENKTTRWSNNMDVIDRQRFARGKVTRTYFSYQNCTILSHPLCTKCWFVHHDTSVHVCNYVIETSTQAHTHTYTSLWGVLFVWAMGGR